MIRRLYDWTMGLAGHRRATWGLAGVSFAESSFFPIPPDVLLIPMILANRRKAFFYALIATIASVLGGLAGYAIGYFLFDTLGRSLLEIYGALEKFQEFSAQYNEQGAWIVFFFGVTPFPYKVITIASGATALDLATFTAASVAARGLRFFIVAGLLWWLGEPIRNFIEKYLGILTVVFMVCLIGGFVAVRYFF
ncbi:MAG: YqaA family protein [Minwuia sp.]|uniref:YqaA family protein n=1 Tax=Minwuia sp. TaxID=2493630 RepID=UPI003A877797